MFGILILLNIDADRRRTQNDSGPLSVWHVRVAKLDNFGDIRHSRFCLRDNTMWRIVTDHDQARPSDNLTTILANLKFKCRSSV